MGAQEYKRLGASKPAATTNTALVVIAADKSASIVLHMCNQSSTADRVRVAHINGAIGDLAAEDYLLYDYAIEGNGARDKAGITMEANHTLMVYSTGGNVSFVAEAIQKI